MATEEHSPDEIDYALSTLTFFEGDVKAAAKFLRIPSTLLQQWVRKAERSAKPKPLRLSSKRPLPPEILIDGDPAEVGGLFLPAPEVTEFAQSVFIIEKGSLTNPDHAHLEGANIGVLWTNVSNARQGRMVAGTAEIPGGGTGSKWTKEKAAYQQRQWFGAQPLDFLITLYAPYSAECPDAAFCALIEHELYHCAQRLDMFGAPAWSRQGRPLYTIKAHDAEEFVGVVRRYGVGAAAGGVAELVEAGNRKPSIAPAAIASVCGTCQR